jgi:hypothetical protein
MYEDNFSYTPASGTGTYIGGGKVTLLPRMNIKTKDFNPFMEQGKQVKTGYIDLLVDPASGGQINIQLYGDTATREQGNLLVGQTKLSLAEPSQFYAPAQAINWRRFYSTLFGQFISMQITYNEDQMNDRTIVNSPFVMNAIIFWFKPGGRISSL